MLKILLWLGYGLAAALLADLITRRLAARGECGLHRALILPNSCRGACPPGQRCVAFVTRPHWLGGRQAVGCGCIAARAGGSPVEPPDFAGLPRSDDDRPEDDSPDRPPVPAPEREDETT